MRSSGRCCGRAADQSGTFSLSPAGGGDDLRKEALQDPTVQAMLEIFPVERTDIEEM